MIYPSLQNSVVLTERFDFPIRGAQTSRMVRVVQRILDDPHGSGEGRDNHKDTSIGKDYGTCKPSQINGDVGLWV